MADQPLTLLIVDDHALLREGLASLLRQAAQDMTVLQANSSEEALRAVAATPGIDAVLLDLLMPRTDGMGALAALRAQYPALPVLVVSASENPEHVRAALTAGALGYVPKSAAPQTLLAALRMILAGEVYVPALMLDDAGSAPTPRGLTGRQRDVLRMLVQGRSNKEIGRALMLSEKTVKAHVTAVLRELEAVNRTEAAMRARQRGLA